MENFFCKKKVKNNKGIKMDIGGLSVLSPELDGKSPRRPVECRRS
jgi:hypothetical protein